MPTAAKFLAAVLLILTGWFGAELVKPLIEDGRPVKYLNKVPAALGLFLGWKFLGPRMDKGLGSVGANGATTTVLMLGLSLFIFSFSEMIRRSMRKQYDGPIEALQDVFEVGLEYALKYVNLEVGVGVLLGCMMASWIANIAARKWG